MPDFPASSVGSFTGALNSWGQVGGSISGEAMLPNPSTAWPSANMALFLPVIVDAPIQIQRLGWLNGASVAGSVDAGIFDINGTKLCSTGSTTQSGTNVIQSASCTATWLDPGFYFLALASNTTSATFFARVSVTAGALQGYCVQQQTASAFPLPSTATFANPGSAYYPMVIASSLTVI